jgi:hypothetical protein
VELLKVLTHLFKCCERQRIQSQKTKTNTTCCLTPQTHLKPIYFKTLIMGQRQHSYFNELFGKQCVTLATILVITIFYQEYQYGAVNSSQNTSSLKSIQSNNPFTFHIVFQTTR